LRKEKKVCRLESVLGQRDIGDLGSKDKLNH